jgi:acyl-CoA thioester hydrolase
MNVFDFQVQWADLDANNHVKNARYLDYASQTRVLFLAQAGFTPQAFVEMGIGPIVFEDRVQYMKELRLLDRFRVDVQAKGANQSGSRFILLNRILNEAGEECAQVWSHGAWFDLRQRKIVPPPPTLMAAMQAMPRSADFESL